MRIQVMYFEGCPNAEATLNMVRKVAERISPGALIEGVLVESPEKAEEVGFLGSPSVRVDGVDIERRFTERGTLACRTYENNSGVPPEWLVEAAVLNAAKPKGFLFLCVANSARSQMAEGIAKKLAPKGVDVWSAGSAPSSVKPEAVAVMKELGIDISSHKSKSTSEIPSGSVDTVITLCAEEECPLFLGEAVRIHWGLPDPAIATGGPEERLAAFREVRDELYKRLKMVFHE